MNTFWKAQIFVLVLLASTALWSQAGSTPASQANQSNSGASVNRVQVSGKEEERHLLHRVLPAYPEYAKQNRIQGMVVMHALIDKEGRITDLKLVAGHRLFVPSTLEAVKQWRYRPYLVNGRVVEVETTITVNFNLTKEKQLLVPASLTH